MSRVTVHHLTPLRRLPLIEVQGLRTRAQLSQHLGSPRGVDEAAPGAYGHGKRVSAYLRRSHAVERVDVLGAGLVEFTVDPAKTLAAPESLRRSVDDPADYWQQARPLADWLEGERPPGDLEVHRNVAVRAKHVRIRAPLLDQHALGDYAPMVEAIADEDRLAAKALMHLCMIAADGDPDTEPFRAACALAWRDAQDPPGLIDELARLDADKVVSAALAELQRPAPEAATRLRGVVENTRSWADANGIEHGQALFARAAVLLDELPAKIGDQPRATDSPAEG